MSRTLALKRATRDVQISHKERFLKLPIFLLRLVEFFTTLFGMWFTKVEAATPAEPAPTDYVTACHERMRQAKDTLDEINREMLVFKQSHRVRATGSGILLSIESPTLSGRAKIETEWRGLLKRRDAAVAEFYSSTHEWATAKTERERKEVTA